MQILDNRKIELKIKRLAIEIHENHHLDKIVYLAGINNNGLYFAELLENQLRKYDSNKYKLVSIRLNPADPIASEVSLNVDIKILKGEKIIIIDDVANTGRTLFYACKPLLDILPKNLETAVLVDRKHKSFPIEVRYVGTTLFTTFNENIIVSLKDKNNKAVFLN